MKTVFEMNESESFSSIPGKIFTCIYTNCEGLEIGWLYQKFKKGQKYNRTDINKALTYYRLHKEYYDIKYFGNENLEDEKPSFTILITAYVHNPYSLIFDIEDWTPDQKVLRNHDQVLDEVNSTDLSCDINPVTFNCKSFDEIEYETDVQDMIEYYSKD